MAIDENKINPHEWVNRYADELFGYAKAKTSDTELAEDIVQETFLAGLKSLPNFKGESSERTWLYSILKNKIADHYKKASTKYEVNNSEYTKEDDSFLDNYFDEEGEWKKSTAPQKWGIDYSSSIENKELAAILEKCMDKLPKNQKQLIYLKLIQEDKTETVCKELNITSTNYWVLIHRAKLLLRACIEKNWINT
jgi:RNA polymerase sigma-70 factor (ECF subfamily)